jgi:hypothetical protein
MKEYMKTLCFVCLFVLFLLSGVSSAAITVDANRDLWLAGMPDGTWAIRNIDKAPDQSPVQVTGLTIYGGESLSFSVTGATRHAPGITSYGPDGNVGSMAQHELSYGYNVSENGMSNISAPFDSLIGVFLDSSQPSSYAAPNPLSYNMNDTSFSPLLRQVFFIGDGKTGSGITQTFIVPAGATRLYLGTMDTYEWINNNGQLQVDVTSSVPIPGAILLFAPGLAGLIALKRRIKK